MFTERLFLCIFSSGSNWDILNEPFKRKRKRRIFFTIFYCLTSMIYLILPFLIEGKPGYLPIVIWLGSLVLSKLISITSTKDIIDPVSEYCDCLEKIINDCNEELGKIESQPIEPLTPMYREVVKHKLRSFILYIKEPNLFFKIKEFLMGNLLLSSDYELFESISQYIYSHLCLPRSLSNNSLDYQYRKNYKVLFLEEEFKWICECYKEHSLTGLLRYHPIEDIDMIIKRVIFQGDETIWIEELLQSLDRFFIHSARIQERFFGLPNDRQIKSALINISGSRELSPLFQRWLRYDYLE